MSSHDPFFSRSLSPVVFFLSALLSWLSRGRLPFSFLLRQNGLRGRVQGKVKGGGNDFEIFVAVHKFEGGGRAYLNTGRAFLRPTLPRDRLILVRPLLPHRCRSSPARAAVAGSYLISFILPRFSSSSSSSSFRVSTSIVSRALINYPEGHPT